MRSGGSLDHSPWTLDPGPWGSLDEVLACCLASLLGLVLSCMCIHMHTDAVLGLVLSSLLGLVEGCGDGCVEMVCGDGCVKMGGGVLARTLSSHTWSAHT